MFNHPPYTPAEKRTTQSERRGTLEKIELQGTPAVLILCYRLTCTILALICKTSNAAISFGNVKGSHDSKDDKAAAWAGAAAFTRGVFSVVVAVFVTVDFAFTAAIMPWTVK